MMNVNKCLVALLVLVSACAAQAQRAEWETLFNGRNLDGWTSTGAADAWGVQNGQIVTLQPGTGGWLRTNRMFRDFEMVIDFYMPEGGNSGLGLRGSSNGDPAFTGFEIQMLDTHGEAPGLRNCGAVYEAIPPKAMAVREAGNWNTYRVRLVGAVLNVWLNGEHIHQNERLDDRGFFRNEGQPLPLNARATTGYIAVQDHGHAFKFRNIRILDLSPDPEPKGMRRLVDADLSQWFKTHSGDWTVENGSLVGRDGPGHLFTKEAFRGVELRMLVKTNDKGNSGVYTRARPNPNENVPWPVGYEAQVDHNDPRNFTGAVYDRAWPTYFAGPITRDNAWFDYRVRIEGERLRTWINGVPMVDVFLDDYAEGHIALQTHHAGNVIEYRDVRMLNLSD